MAGVLTAIAVQSWYVGRTDRVREQAYVRQLRGELAVSVAQLQRQLLIQRESERAAVQLQRAVLSRVRPAEDSLAKWAIDLNYYSDPAVSLGTARALLTTGDVLLLRDGRMRSALVDVVERADYVETQLRIWQPYFLDAIDRLDSILSNTQLIAAHGFTARLDTLTASRDWLPPAGARRPVTAPVIGQLLDNTDFQHILRAVRLAAANLRNFQEVQLEAVRAAQRAFDQVPIRD